jgi:hypothetical protein
MGRPARAGHTRTRRQDTQGRLAARHSARRWNGGRYVSRGEAAGQRPFVACRSGQVTSEAVGAAVLQALRFSLRIRRLGVRMPSGARCWLRQTPQVRAPERPHGPGLLRCPGPDRAQNGTAQDTQAEFLVIPETVPVSLHGLPWAQPAHHEGDGSGARAVPHLAQRRCRLRADCADLTLPLGLYRRRAPVQPRVTRWTPTSTSTSTLSAPLPG